MRDAFVGLILLLLLAAAAQAGRAPEFQAMEWRLSSLQLQPGPLEGDWSRGDKYEEVLCESRNSQPATCAADGPVRFAFVIRQLSAEKRGPCQEGQTWFRKTQGIQVTNGCRALFGVLRD